MTKPKRTQPHRTIRTHLLPAERLSPLISETEAYMLAHYNRQTLRRETNEIRQFDRMRSLADRISYGLLDRKYLERGFGGLGITDAGKAALKEWREWHENEWPSPPWKRAEFRGLAA